MSRLTYIPCFSITFCNFADIFFDKNSFEKSISLKAMNQIKPNLDVWSLDGPFSKLSEQPHLLSKMAIITK